MLWRKVSKSRLSTDFLTFPSPSQPQSSPSYQIRGLECIITNHCVQSNYSLIWLVAQQNDKSTGCQAGSEISHCPLDRSSGLSSCLWRPLLCCGDESAAAEPLFMTWSVFKTQDSSMQFGFLVSYQRDEEHSEMNGPISFAFYVNFKWNMYISQY